MVPALGPWVWHMPIIPALWRLKLDQEFKANFSYLMSLRPAWTIRDPAKQQKAKQNKTKPAQGTESDQVTLRTPLPFRSNLAINPTSISQTYCFYSLVRQKQYNMWGRLSHVSLKAIYVFFFSF